MDFRLFLSSATGRIGIVVVLFFILASLLAPIIAPGDPAEFVGDTNQAPSAEHIFGTDPQGKDVFRQTVWGGRISLAIGFGTAILAVFVAVVIGMTAGYFGGIVDDLLTLLMNLFLVIPGLPLLILLAAYLQPSTSTVIGTLALTGWAFHARIFRSQVLSLREKDFVAASIVSGERDFTIIFQQILPNMINTIVGSFIGSLIYGIGAATALSFLGLTEMTDVTWGTNLFWAQNGGALFAGAWWAFVPSGICVALTAFGLSLINYGMDEITNPRLRAERELKQALKNVVALRRVRATPVMRRTH